MTRIESARKGLITEEIKEVSRDESVSPEYIAEGLREGTIVITRNKFHNIKPLAIGKGLRTKINANIGSSKDRVNIEEELEKLKVIIKYGADAVMDLSTGGPIKELRLALLRESSIPVGTVPVYEAAVRAVELYGSIKAMTEDLLFEVIEEHLREGVDFITVHAGLTLKAIERFCKQGWLSFT
jgi:phosphomethylpyrimidine synthase